MLWAMSRIRAVVPGIAAAAAVAVLATVLARAIGAALGYAQSPVSPVLLAVATGLAVANLLRVPSLLAAGITFCAGPLLRFGVALLGIRLSLGMVGSIGMVALPLVAACIIAAIVLMRWLTNMLKLPPRLGALIAAGTSICGITAIVAVAPVIEARDDESSYAVATIALFGMATLLVYPFLAHVLFDTPTQVGLFLGTSIHDTSQVVGAAMAYDQQYTAPAAVDTAVVTKLLRNLALIVVVPLMAFFYAPRENDAEQPARRVAVPFFIVAFVGMALLRTLGDAGARPFGVLSAETWEGAVSLVERAAAIALLLAMAAVGLRTSLARLRLLGLRPLAAGLAAAVTVGGVSAALIHLFGG